MNALRGRRTIGSLALTATLIPAGCIGLVRSAPPEFMRYQARLADPDGVPLSGSRDLTFSIWDAETGGNALWTEGPRSIDLPNGLLDVLLGEVTPIPSSTFSAPHRWLEVAIGGVPLSPRERLAAVAYAHTSDRLGDRTVAQVVDRVEHTGTQPPSAISPQGEGSGLDADMIDGLHASELQNSVAAPQPNRAVATTISPTTQADAYTDIPEMSVTMSTAENSVVLVHFSSSFTHDSDHLESFVALNVDGTVETQSEREFSIPGIEWMTVELDFLKTGLAPGPHTFTIQWKTATGTTLTSTGTMRSMQAIEIKQSGG